MNRKKHAYILRGTRKIHRQLGVILFSFFIIVGSTGLLLGWKKNVSALQQPPEQGISTNMDNWLSMDSLILIANEELVKQRGVGISLEVDKIDARPTKGMVKVIYKQHYYSVQLDAVTGQVLAFEYRTSDLIEHLHDGTFIDQLFHIPGGIFKLIYTSILSLALITFSVTGFWLWYGPKIMRRLKSS